MTPTSMSSSSASSDYYYSIKEVGSLNDDEYMKVLLTNDANVSGRDSKDALESCHNYDMEPGLGRNEKKNRIANNSNLLLGNRVENNLI